MSHQCAAITTRGKRCRKEGRAYWPLDGEQEILLCPDHQRAAHNGQLRTPSEADTAAKRRDYRSSDPDKPMPLDALPFVSQKENGRTRGRPKRWDVPEVADYGEACAKGSEYAAHFIQYLKDNPFWVGSSLLGGIAADIDFNDDTAAKGYWVGFFSHLERYIHSASRFVDVFGDLKRVQEMYADIENARKAEAQGDEVANRG